MENKNSIPNWGKRDESGRTHLGENPLIGPLAVVVEHQLGRGQVNGRVGEMVQRRDAGPFLLVDDLARYLADEIFGQRRAFGHDVLGRVGLPRDGQTNVAPDLTVTVARRASHSALGVALQAILNQSNHNLSFLHGILIALTFAPHTHTQQKTGTGKKKEEEKVSSRACTRARSSRTLLY